MNLLLNNTIEFDTIILEEGIIKLPELSDRKNENIHIVIEFTERKQFDNSEKSLAGKLKKYANPSLIEFETKYVNI